MPRSALRLEAALSFLHITHNGFGSTRFPPKRALCPRCTTMQDVCESKFGWQTIVEHEDKHTGKVCGAGHIDVRVVLPG